MIGLGLCTRDTINHDLKSWSPSSWDGLAGGTDRNQITGSYLEQTDNSETDAGSSNSAINHIMGRCFGAVAQGEVCAVG